MRRLSLLLTLLIVQYVANGQVKPSEAGIFAQEYSKEITEYVVKDYIIKNILQVPEKTLIDVKIDALTASQSGELTTVVYNCEALKKSGLIFVFWNRKFNEDNTHYNEYSYREFDLQQAKEFLDEIYNIINGTKGFLQSKMFAASVNNAVYKYEDMILIFYKDQSGGAIFMRILWNDCDSKWGQTSFEVTRSRFNKFFNDK